MVQPITWRNINSPNFRASNQLLESGASDIQKAIQGGAGIFNRMNTETTAENTEDMLAQIRGLKSLDQYNQANQGGRFTRDALDSFGGQIDKSKITAAFEGQLGRAEAPVRQNIENLIAQKKYGEAQELIGSSGLRDTAGLTGSILSSQRGDESQRRSDVTYGQQQDRFARTEQARLATEAVQENIFSKQIAQDESDAIHREDLNIEFAEKFGNNAIVNADGIVELTDAAKFLPDYERDSIKQAIDIHNEENKKPTTRQAVADTRAFFKTDKGKGISAKVRNEIIAGVRESSKARKTDYTDAARRTMLVERSTLKGDFDDISKLEDRKHSEALAKLPVTYDVTNEMENIKKGHTLTQMRNDFSKIAKNLDDPEKTKLIKGMNNAIDAGYNGKKYDGWVISEAYANVGIEGIFEMGTFNDVINFGLFEQELARVQQLALEDKTNRDRRSTLESIKQENDAKRSAAFIRNSNAITSKAEKQSNI